VETEDGFNHFGDELLQLIADWPIIKAATQTKSWNEGRLDFTWHRTTYLIQFLIDHDGHEVVPFNEYGRTYAQEHRPQHSSCSHCNGTGKGEGGVGFSGCPYCMGEGIIEVAKT